MNTSLEKNVNLTGMLEKLVIMTIIYSTKECSYSKVDLDIVPRKINRLLNCTLPTNLKF